MQSRILTCILLISVLLNFASALPFDVFERAANEKRSTCSNTGAQCDVEKHTSSTKCCQRTDVCALGINSIVKTCINLVGKPCANEGSLCTKSLRCSQGNCLFDAGQRCEYPNMSTKCIEGYTCLSNALKYNKNAYCRKTETITST